MFGGKIKMLEERRGNRMRADVITDKTKKLGWDASYKLVDYIEVLRANKWQAPK